MSKRQKVGVDARGRTVRIEDTIIDKRGRVYTIFWTEKALRKRGSVRAQPLQSDTGYVFVSLPRVFRVKRASSTALRNRMRWRRFYDKYVRPARRAAARKRRKVEASTKMWPCPVCKNGGQPTRFKIGIRVWDGKRLRVCSAVCKRRVLKEVKKLRDGERVRRRVAWKYMKIGGQVCQNRTSQTKS